MDDVSDWHDPIYALPAPPEPRRLPRLAFLALAPLVVGLCAAMLYRPTATTTTAALPVAIAKPSVPATDELAPLPVKKPVTKKRPDLLEERQ